MPFKSFLQNHLLSSIERDQQTRRLLMQKALRFSSSLACIVDSIWINSVSEAEEDTRRLFHLAQQYGPHRLEGACRRALYYGRHRNSRLVKWILKKGLDRLPLTTQTDICGHPAIEPEWPTYGFQNNLESKIICDNHTE